MAGYKNRLLLFMGDSLFFALTNNRLFRCTPCGVIGFSAYRSVGAQADSVGSAFDGVSASHFERSGRSADGVSDLIAGDLSVLLHFRVMALELLVQAVIAGLVMRIVRRAVPVPTVLPL